MNCQGIIFSPIQSQKRIERALRVLPSQVLKRILLFALYLLGARLNNIASVVEMPKESVKTTINRVMRDGLSAFYDRRQSVETYGWQLLPPPQEPQASVLVKEDYCAITFGNMNHQLKIQRNYQVYLRTILLSLLQVNLLAVHTVSSILGITAAHCRELAAKLVNYGVTEVLVDKRKGQKQDFRFDLSVKAELIQQFAARAVTGYPTSSQALTKIINDTQKTAISPRTVRWHMNKLGLTQIKKTLPELFETLKKNF
jgi:hypothetical protein